MTRIRALLVKELIDLRRNPAVFFPAVLTGILTVVLPFVIAIIIPYVTGERLSDSSDFEAAIESYQGAPAETRFDPEGAIQAFIFQQFLVMLVLTPVAGSMSMAAHSVIGEKQARTLEPLLATPLTTLELLSAKVLGSFLPAVGLTILSFTSYVIGVAILGRPGVFLVLLRPGPLSIVFVLGPLAALAALQLAVCVSSRVNDARSAQQIGALIILPIAGLLVAQLSGVLVLTGGIVALLALALATLNVVLMGIGIRLFQRETILTRWK